MQARFPLLSANPPQMEFRFRSLVRRYIDRRPTRMEAIATKTEGFALFFYRLHRDQRELAQVVIIERALSVGSLI